MYHLFLLCSYIRLQTKIILLKPIKYKLIEKDYRINVDSLLDLYH